MNTNKDTFVLVRWSGVNTLSIVSQVDAKIDDSKLQIGNNTSVYHKDLKNRGKAFLAKILGFGSE